MSERDEIADAAGGEPPAVSSSADDRKEAPLYQVTLWPNRSLSRRGFQVTLLVAGIGLAIPLLPVLGSPVGVALFPFLAGALLMLWGMIRLNYRAGRLTETLTISPTELWVERREPTGRILKWVANPYWVSVDLRATRTIDQYLTLSSSGRTIELGAFLTAGERVVLAEEIRQVLHGLLSGRPASIRHRNTAAAPL